MTENKKICRKIIRWKNYILGAWENYGQDGSKWLNYEVQRNQYLGETNGKKSWRSQSLSLTKLEDLCYLKTLVRSMIATHKPVTQQKFSFVSQKIVDEKEKEKWKDKENPTKEELRKSLKLIHFYRKYRDKEKNVKETKRFIINVYELDILRDFVEHCISRIDSIYDGERREYKSNYQDNVNYTNSSENKGEFIDQPIDDEIPF